MKATRANPTETLATVERDLVALWIQPHMLIADTAMCVRQLPCRRHAAFGAEETPGTHQRADGDVEGAVGLTRQPLRPFKLLNARTCPQSAEKA